MYDMVKVRHGLMMVGEATSAKSAVVKCLQGGINLIDGNQGFNKI
jgi:hypothetical protein